MVSVEDKSSNDFSQQSSDFVDWFSSAQGTRLSDKIQLSDLRGRGAGRGASMYKRSQFGALFTYLSYSCCGRPERG